MKNVHALTAALTAVALALAAGSAGAQVVNGDFHNGLAGWQSAGDVAANQGGSGQLVLTNASSTYQDDADANLPAGARNVSGNDPLAVGQPRRLRGLRRRAAGRVRPGSGQRRRRL